MPTPFLRRCLGIELDKAVPFRVTLAIRGNLCGNNVTELRERISQPDCINVLVQVLDEDVPDAGLTNSRISLRVQDANRLPIDDLKVQHVNRSGGILRLREVHVGVSKGSSRD